MKSYFIFFLFVFSIFNISYADIEPYCNGNLTQNNLKKVDRSEIKKIKIEVNEYRKWQKNTIRILIGNTRIIPNNLKKSYKARISVFFNNNISCSFLGKIRQHGDFKDHVKLKDGHVIQSLDVRLDTGHINGVTKFKLYVPGTRGNSEDEIIITELLRELGYLAPRTMYVETNINEIQSKMIFQEKAVKEMLEYNLRREGPILEGDERYMMKLAEKFQSNQKSNIDIGMLPELEKGVRAQLARQSNSNWAIKSQQHSNISFQSLTYLNRAYLLYLNNFKNEKNDFIYSEYNLDNNLLALGKREKILELDIYNLIIFATNGWHSMSSHNRKFYWNSFENYFEPIYYDANIKIDETTTNFNLPFSYLLEEALILTKKKLENIDIKSFQKKIISRGLNIKESILKDRLEKIIKNIKIIGDLTKNTESEIVNFNRNLELNDNSWQKYFDYSKKVNFKIKFLINGNKDLLKNFNGNGFIACDNYLKNCKSIYLSKNEIRDLIEGRLNLENLPNQYLGLYKSNNKLVLDNQEKFNKLNFENTTLIYDDDINIEIDNKNRVINIYQTFREARVLFLGGSLSDVKINFFGIENFKQNNLKKYPFDKKGLTGCLTFSNLQLSSVSIYSEKSNCEDAINLVNTNGSINLIESLDSYRDGLDIDFSNLRINEIIISNAGNDCTDLSGGKYKIEHLSLSNCNDKALSVGEKSILKLKNVNIINAQIGLSSKDSSIVYIENAKIKNSNTCFEAKRKKQEFSGGIINISNANCFGSPSYIQKGSFINYL